MFYTKTTAFSCKEGSFACMKIMELCVDERPREKMLDKGAATLSDAELLAILLRTGTGSKNAVDLARELLHAGDGRLNGIASMPVEKLCSISGIGPSKAVTVAAAFELGRRSAAEPFVHDRTPVSSPRTVYRLMLPVLRGLDHEECWALFLNRANYLLGKERMSSGGMESTVLDVKSVLRRAIDRKASGVILVHNHPSGNALPGHADISRTDLLRNALKSCDIQLIDHVVIAEDSWYSFADETLENEKF